MPSAVLLGNSFATGAAVRTRARAATAAPAVRRHSVFVVAAGIKVTILGAAGGIGQPLSLLMKMNPLVTQLALYDIANTPGVACDLSHCNTPAKARGYVGPEQLGDALTGSDLVIIPAGVPRKPGMTRDDLFAVNAGIVKNLVESIAKYCPKAIVNIISNPVNSTVPIAAEVMKKAGVYSPSRILGVTSLDIVRANTFVAEAKGLDLREVDVPVIGGHAGVTILPLLSQCTPKATFADDEVDKLTVRIQNAGTEVVEAKAGTGSATLSMAYAGARFAEACLRGLAGEGDAYECAYVASSVVPGLAYFSTKVKLGRDGVEKIFPVGSLSTYEQKKLDEMIPQLKVEQEKGVKFVLG